MARAAAKYDITKDDLSCFGGKGPAFVTFGEVMVRDTPADMERPERTRLVHLSMAGSEYTLAIGLSRLGIPSAYITRVPDNPYGRAHCLGPKDRAHWTLYLRDWSYAAQEHRCISAHVLSSLQAGCGDD